MEHLTESTTPAVTEEDIVTVPPTVEEAPAPADITPSATDEGTLAAQDPLPDPVDAVDYDALAAQDLAELRRLVPTLRISHIGELPGAERYGELRDLGLSVEEAFRAACHGAVSTHRDPYDNRSHLHSAVPRGAARNPAVMSASEMRAAKELFGDLSESEIQKLYAKCRA